MKKVAFCLAFVLMVSFLFTACRGAGDGDVYSVAVDGRSLGDVSVDTSKYETLDMSGEQVGRADAAREKTESLLGVSHELEYQYSTNSNIFGDNLDYYSDSASGLRLAYSTSTGRLARILAQSGNGQPDSGQPVSEQIMPYDKPTLTADEYLLWLKSLASQVFAVSLEEYSVVGQTHYEDNTVENAIVPAAESGRAVSFYYVEFAKYYAGYKSAECVKVIANPDGGVRSLTRSEFPPAVSGSPLSIDEKKLNRTLEKTVSDICRGKSYTVRSTLLQYYKGQPTLMCGVEIGGDSKSLIVIGVSLA